MNARQLVAGLLETEENIDWSVDPNDPDTRLREPDRTLKTVHVVGRRWYRRTYGGVYCTVDIYINGKLAAHLSPQYGYGDHYMTLALDWLKRNDYIPPQYKDAHALWWLQDKMDFKLTNEVHDVKRERDL